MAGESFRTFGCLPLRRRGEDTLRMKFRLRFAPEPAASDNWPKTPARRDADAARRLIPALFEFSSKPPRVGARMALKTRHPTRS